MRKTVQILLVILAVAVALCVGYLASIRQPLSTPAFLYNYTVYSANGTPASMLNTTQGSTYLFNLTLTAFSSSTPIAVPIEGLKVIGYNSGNYSVWHSDVGNDTILQRAILNCSASPSTLNLQPNQPNSTIITVMWADDAPAGEYTVEVSLGNFSFLSTPNSYDLSYGSSFELSFDVAPKVIE